MKEQAIELPTQRGSIAAEAILVGRASSDRRAFATEHAEVSWQEWVADVRHVRNKLVQLEGSLALRFRPCPLSYSWLVALAAEGQDVYLLDEALDRAAADELCSRHYISHIVDPDLGELVPTSVSPAAKLATAPAAGSITIFTSGSTGVPKPVHHRWDTLVRPVRCTDSARFQCWLLTYRPQLYAGLQVFLQCLLNEGTLVIPKSTSSVGELVDCMRRHRVECVS